MKEGVTVLTCVCWGARVLHIQLFTRFYVHLPLSTPHIHHDSYVSQKFTTANRLYRTCI